MESCMSPCGAISTFCSSSLGILRSYKQIDDIDVGDDFVLPEASLWFGIKMHICGECWLKCLCSSMECQTWGGGSGLTCSFMPPTLLQLRSSGRTDQMDSSCCFLRLGSTINRLSPQLHRAFRLHYYEPYPWPRTLNQCSLLRAPWKTADDVESLPIHPFVEAMGNDGDRLSRGTGCLPQVKLRRSPRCVSFGSGSS